MIDHYFLYLHGYQSSPTTLRALKLQLWLRESFPEARIDAPRIASSNAFKAFQMINTTLDQVESKRKILIGASLGGLVAHLMKQSRDDVTDVILINPALHFDAVIANMGLTSGSSDQTSINQDDIALIQSLMPEKSYNQKDYLLLLQKDDDICHYSSSLDLLPEAHKDIQAGQGHNYTHIETAFSAIQSFMNR